MSYPTPRFGAMPKTPKQMDDGLVEVKSRPSNSFFPAWKRYIVHAITVTLVLLWLRYYTSSSGTTDRVPFTHDPVEEYTFRLPSHPLTALADSKL